MWIRAIAGSRYIAISQVETMARIPKVMDHRTRVSARFKVRKASAGELGIGR